MSKSEIKKQVEYYLSDKNLAHDNFFYDKIQADKEVMHHMLILVGMDGCSAHNELQ